MKTEDKQFICEYLRKTETKQAFGRLCDGHCRCVLGAISDAFQAPENYSRTFYLPVSLQDRLAMTHRGDLPEKMWEKWGGKSLLFLNDVKKMTFTQLAAVIEDCF